MVGTGVHRDRVLDNQLERIKIHVSFDGVDHVQPTGHRLGQAKCYIYGSSNGVRCCKFRNEVHLYRPGAAQELAAAGSTCATVGNRAAVVIRACDGWRANSQGTTQKILRAGVLRTTVNGFDRLRDAQTGTGVADVNCAGIRLRANNGGARNAGSQNLVTSFNSVARVTVIAMGADQTFYAYVLIGIAIEPHRAVGRIIALHACILRFVANRGRRTAWVRRVGRLAASKYVAGLITVAKGRIQTECIILNVGT